MSCVGSVLYIRMPFPGNQIHSRFQLWQILENIWLYPSPPWHITEEEGGAGKIAAQNHTYSVGQSRMHSKEVWPSSTRNTIPYLTLGPLLSLFLFSFLTVALAMQTRDRVLTQCELIGLP